MRSNRKISRALTMLALAGAVATPALASDGRYDGRRVARVIEGADNNNADNPFIQPQDPALSGGGRDQSLQDGDILFGKRRRDVIIGRIGVDVLAGDRGADILIGGPEHFNPNNRDRAFGERGRDMFIWAPGDGTDFFSGGPGRDVLVLGLLGELEAGKSHPVFRVSTDQQAGDVFLDDRDLPRVNVTDSPGFCSVIDRYSSDEAAEELAELDLDHLVRFTIRGVADAFEAGRQNEDNGLRVTIHLQDVEFLVCTPRDGNGIEVLDLRYSPPRRVDLRRVRVPNLEDIVF